MSYQLYQYKQRLRIALNRADELHSEKEVNDIRRDENASVIEYLRGEILRLEVIENPILKPSRRIEFV